MTTQKYIRYKKRTINNQNGGGFVDDLSSFGAYALYGHGGLPKNSGTFKIPDGINIVYLEDYGDALLNNKSRAIWKLLSELDNSKNVEIILKISAGCIDNSVTNYKYDNIYPFKITKFKKSGTIINDVDMYFMPLNNGDLANDDIIKNDDPVTKSGLYSIPIGLNYPFKNYCNNLQGSDVMEFINYIGTFIFGDKKLSEVQNINQLNVFSGKAYDTYKCGLIGNLPKNPTIEIKPDPDDKYNIIRTEKTLTIKDDCINVNECDNAHKLLYKQAIIKQKNNNTIPEFLTDKFNYKSFKLSSFINNIGDAFKGTYFVVLCRGSNTLNVLYERLKLLNNYKIEILSSNNKDKNKLLEDIDNKINKYNEDIKKEEIIRENLKKNNNVNLRLSNEFKNDNCNLGHVNDYAHGVIEKLLIVMHKLYDITDKKDALINSLKRALLIYEINWIGNFDDFTYIDPDRNSSKYTRLVNLIIKKSNNFNNEERFKNVSIFIADLVKIIKFFHL
jgi:hypothetical protein